MKIKIISVRALSSSSTGTVDFTFGNEINRWIFNHREDVVIKDIKYSITDEIRSAMILYEEVEDE